MRTWHERCSIFSLHRGAKFVFNTNVLVLFTIPSVLLYMLGPQVKFLICHGHILLLWNVNNRLYNTTLVINEWKLKSITPLKDFLAHLYLAKVMGNLVLLLFHSCKRSKIGWKIGYKSYSTTNLFFLVQKVVDILLRNTPMAPKFQRFLSKLRRSNIFTLRTTFSVPFPSNNQEKPEIVFSKKSTHKLYMGHLLNLWKKTISIFRIRHWITGRGGLIFRKKNRYHLCASQKNFCHFLDEKREFPRGPNHFGLGLN